MSNLFFPISRYRERFLKMSLVYLFMLKEIKTEEKYQEVLEKIYDLMQKDLKVNSDEMKELEVLAIEVEKYEKIFGLFDEANGSNK